MLLTNPDPLPPRHLPRPTSTRRRLAMAVRILTSQVPRNFVTRCHNRIRTTCALLPRPLGGSGVERD
jgi:hypothetical protein